MRVQLDAVTLVPYQPDYLDLFVAWRKQDAMMRFNPLLPLSPDQLADMLAAEGSSLSDLTRYTTFRWFVVVESQVVGSVCLKEISHMMGYGELGYGLDEAWHGRGIGTAAVRQVVERIFAETGLRKLLAMVQTGNVASYRILERLGFQREGVLREHYVIQGRPVDEAVYGLLRQDWVTRSPAAEH